MVQPRLEPGNEGAFHGQCPTNLGFFCAARRQAPAGGAAGPADRQKVLSGVLCRRNGGPAAGLGVGGSSGHTGKKTNLKDPTIIPIINYGVVGINKFKKFDCAFCLTGYFVNERVVNSVLQDVYATDMQIPLKFTTEGLPRRRRVGVANAQDRFYDINRLAQLALNQQEMDVVLQAVGRVRPYTKPREIMTFQCAAHPQLPYTQEFNSLAEARAYFGIVSTRQAQKATTMELVKAAKERGLTQQQVVDELKISLSTVKRYWNP